MKHLFIINPAAGKCDRTVQLKQRITEVFEGRNLSFDIQVSKGPGDCTRLAREAAGLGEELRIYACGGDGTLNEVINGVAGFDHVAVTHFPGGSGNDFIKLFDCPDTFRDLEQLVDGEETVMDLIACNCDGEISYAANICSLGLDAKIAAGVDRYRRLPLVGGKGAYYLSIAANLFGGLSQPFTIELDGERLDGKQTLVCVCNGQFYGGSFHPVPDAVPTDGLLDVLLVKAVHLHQVPAVIGKYQQGRYPELPQLIRHSRTKEIRICSQQPAVVNVDGEILFTQDITFTVLPKALRFFHPKAAQLLTKESNLALAGVN